jgi:signal transduction histidine kinase
MRDATMAPMVVNWWSRPRVADVALVVVTTVFAGMGIYFELRGSARPFPPAAGAYVLVVLVGVLLLQVRRAPVPVTVAIVLLCLLYHEVGYPGLALAIGVSVAVYRVTAQGTGVRSMVVAGGLIVVVNMITMLPRGANVFTWGNAGPALAMIATAAAGEATRARGVAAAEQMRSLRRAADEDARNRLAEQRLDIAREVHDVLAHTVTLIGVQAAAAAEALDSRPEDARAAVAAIRGATKEAMAELRGTLRVLRDGHAGSVAPQPGLAQLSGLVENARTAGVAVTLTVTGETTGLAATVELTVYRVVQEALTNTIRHSRSSRSTVTIDVLTEEIVVTATDEGPPSQPAERSAGHGLIGLAERVRALGGTVDAGPGPAAGFRVTARVPR